MHLASNRILHHVVFCFSATLAVYDFAVINYLQVEHIIREDYLVEAMELIELYCDLLLARFGLIESMKYVLLIAMHESRMAVSMIHFTFVKFLDSFIGVKFFALLQC